MIRVGVGYDTHPLVEGRALVVGGVYISHSKGLAGHSDSDVLVHALIDAMLGAAALGDIGAHFAPSDPRFKDADSLGFLRETARLLSERRWLVSNLDATIIAQEPHLAPYVQEMRATLGRVLKLDVSQVSVKGKSTNGLGFEGRQEGIAALAVVLIESTP